MFLYYNKTIERLERLLRIDLRYTIRSGFWLNLNSGVTILGSFIVSVAFANLVPKEIFGTYQYLLSIFALLSAFTLTGMNASITQAVAQGNDDALRASIRPQLIWNSFASVLAFSISGYYLLQGDLRLGIGTLIIALALPLVATFNSYGAFLMGKQRFRIFFLYATAANVSYYIAILITISLTPTVLPLIGVNLLCTALAPFILYVATVRAFRLKHSVAKKEDDPVSYGKHLSLMNLLGTVSSQIDSFLVFHFLGPVQLATYSIATLIPDRLSGLLKNFTNAVLPRFAEHPFHEVRRNIVRKSILFFLVIAVGIALYIYLVPFLFAWIYPKYIEAVPYTQLFSLTLVVAVGNLVGSTLLAHKKIRSLYLINTLAPITSLLFQTAGLILGGLWGLILGRIAGSLFFLLITLYMVLLYPATGDFRPN